MSSTYLVKRPASRNWYYREQVPADVRPLLVNSGAGAPLEVWRSTRTADLKEAKSRLPRIRAAQHAAWDALRAGAPTPSLHLPSRIEMADAVVDHVHELFLAHQTRALRARVAKGLNLADEARRNRERIALETVSPSAEDEAHVERFAAWVTKKMGWSLGPGDDSTSGVWTELVELVRKAVNLARSDAADTMDGRPPTYGREQVIARLGVAPAPLANQGETIGDLFDRYEKETLRLASKKAATVATERKVVEHFATFVGERRAVSDIGEKDVREFKAALLAVPNRWTTHKDLKGLLLRDAAHQWEARGGKGRSPTTIRRELSAVSTFFKWLKTNAFYSGGNPVADFFPAVDRKKNKYPPYSQEELTAVFASPLFHRCRSAKLYKAGEDEVRDWRYWLPLCALFTGARAGEIAQLSCSDVRQEEGVWIFDINDHADAVDEGEDKSVKTASSRRQVPVHPALLALGFVEHVGSVRAAGGRRVFPQIKPGPDGSWSYQPSKFWQRYLSRLGLKRRGLGLHSFRHGFADECRRRSVPDEVIKGLMGHADGSQTAHYGTLRSGNLGQRQDAINALSFFGLGAGLPQPASG